MNEKGSSQGGVISPLLANIYLNALDTWWEKNGAEVGRLVRYADDMVIICKSYKDAEQAIELLRYVIWKLDLTLHPTKTRLVSMWSGKEGFDFLGTIKDTSRKEMDERIIQPYSIPAGKQERKCRRQSSTQSEEGNGFPGQWRT